VRNLSLRVNIGASISTLEQIDIMSTTPSGEIAMTEAKSSATAPLTKNQKAAHPEIARTGTTVAGKGKPPYVGGTRIPPTEVKVVRPPKCSKLDCP